MSDTTADCNDLTTNYLSKRNETVSENCIDEDMHYSLNNDDSCDTPSLLNKLKLKNVNRLVIGHLNINSLPHKFDQLKSIIGKNIDILVITETKIDSSFPNSQFGIEGFSMPYRFDRNRLSGGIIVYVRDDIPSKQLTRHKFPEDIEGIFIEVNLRKTKWLIFGAYRPPSQSAQYFFKHVGFALDTYRQSYDKFLFAGDFNIEDNDPVLLEFLTNYDSKNLVKEKTCSKNPENPRCIGLFITNSVMSFQNTTTLASGLADFHKMIVTVCKTSFQKPKPKETVYRNYKKFDRDIFKDELKPKLESITNYESFEDVFLTILNKHVALKKKFLRSNQAPYMTKALRKAIMRRSELESKYFKNKTNENKARFKKQKSFCSKLYKKERKKFYSNLELNEITDNKLFWKTIKPLLSEKCIQSSKMFLVSNNKVISENLELAKTFNNYFGNAVNNLGIKECEFDLNVDSNCNYMNGVDIAIHKFKVHPSIKMINEKVRFESRFSFKEVSNLDIEREISHLNTKKVGTFGNIPTKVLKESFNVYNSTLKDIWNYEISGKQNFSKNLKLADITPVYKKKIQLWLKIIDLSVYYFQFLKFLKGLFKNNFQVL